MNKANIAQKYKTAGTLLLTTLLLFLGLELAASWALSFGRSTWVRDFLAEKMGTPNDIVAHHYNKLSYYEGQEWAKTYWREHRAALKKEYNPYVVWRSPSFSGETLNIDAKGIRKTTGSSCGEGAYQVLVFGGSAMWGWGGPDWGTIPAYLQEILNEMHDGPVCVTNYGEQAFVSTQSLIQLLLILESGAKPDLVIFYDGVNEVFAARQNGKPLVHQNYSEIAGQFENNQSAFIQALQRLGIVQVLQIIVPKSTAANDASGPGDSNVEELARDVVQAYLHTYETVQALSHAFDFKFLMFWQPYILAGNKPLTAEEQHLLTGLNWVMPIDSSMTKLFTSTYAMVEAEAPAYDHLYSMANAFDSTTASVWIDTWGHVTPEGNRLIAEKMATFIE